jgi:hypothetical protein
VAERKALRNSPETERGVGNNPSNPILKMVKNVLI